MSKMNIHKSDTNKQPATGGTFARKQDGSLRPVDKDEHTKPNPGKTAKRLAESGKAKRKADEPAPKKGAQA
jgi:hypothetical protein